MTLIDRRRTMAVRAGFVLIGTIAAAGGGLAQSLDPAHPTPLGPGINRGNIDNGTRGHFFSFVAGPGHVDVEMAFKEMGMFGTPLRQRMNFDFYKEDGTRSAHSAVISQGVIARGHIGGDLDRRQRFTLAVSAQPGAIRLGGYYEIEVKGAAFEGPTVGVGVVPHDSPPLIKPMPGR